jgi:hypothetical protein
VQAQGGRKVHALLLLVGVLLLLLLLRVKHWQSMRGVRVLVLLLLRGQGRLLAQAGVVKIQRL